MFLNYFVPMDAEINTCPHMVFTDSEIKWDTHGVETATNRPYGETYIRVNAMIVGDKRQRVAVEHESDLCLGSISSRLLPEICYERLINSVTVKPLLHRKSPLNKGDRTTKQVKSHTRHYVITVEHLTHKMNIVLKTSKQMIRATIQKGFQTEVHPITRRYRVYLLDLHTSILAGKWYVDWISAGTKFLAQNAGAFIFSDGTFTKFYSFESKQQMPGNMSLNYFYNNIVIPEKLKSDRAPEFCGRNSEFLKYAKRKGIDLTYAEPKHKNRIAPIDVDIRKLRKRTH